MKKLVSNDDDENNPDNENPVVVYILWAVMLAGILFALLKKIF